MSILESLENLSQVVEVVLLRIIILWNVTDDGYAVFSLSSLLTGTCQYPLAKSKVVMNRAFPIWSKSSSTLGMG